MLPAHSYPPVPLCRQGGYGTLQCVLMQRPLRVLTNPCIHTFSPQDVNQRGTEGETALHWAAHGGFRKIAALLIENKACKDLVTKVGDKGGGATRMCGRESRRLNVERKQALQIVRRHTNNWLQLVQFSAALSNSAPLPQFRTERRPCIGRRPRGARNVFSCCLRALTGWMPRSRWVLWLWDRGGCSLGCRLGGDVRCPMSDVGFGSCLVIRILPCDLEETRGPRRGGRRGGACL